MKTRTVRLYIGANNETKELETEKIKATCALFFKGFTFNEAVGFWEGEEEKTAIITVCDEEKKIKDCINILKKACKQDTIAVQKVTNLSFV